MNLAKITVHALVLFMRYNCHYDNQVDRADSGVLNVF